MDGSRNRRCSVTTAQLRNIKIEKRMKPGKWNGWVDCYMPDIPEMSNEEAQHYYERRNEWLFWHGLQKVKPWLKCPGNVVKHGHKCSIFNPHKGRDWCMDLWWFDHTHLYHHTSSHSYVFVTQPYDIPVSAFQRLEEYADKFGLELFLDGKEAWYYPGRTPMVVLSRPGIYVPVENPIYSVYNTMW